MVEVKFGLFIVCLKHLLKVKEASNTDLVKRFFICWTTGLLFTKSHAVSKILFRIIMKIMNTNIVCLLLLLALALFPCSLSKH